MKSYLICLDIRDFIYDDKLKFVILLVVFISMAHSTQSKQSVTLNYIRSTDLLSAHYDPIKRSLAAYPFAIEWSNWQNKRVNKLNRLSSPEELNSLISQLDLVIREVAREFYEIIVSEPITRLRCDKKFTEIPVELIKSNRLLLQLFDPVDLTENSHPCLSRLQQLYGYLHGNEPFQLQIMSSLDWGLKYPSKQDLMLYLWSRRYAWNSYIPSMWHDQTPIETKVSKYSQIVHRIIIERKKLNSKIRPNFDVNKIAILNFDLFRLMHPATWKFNKTNLKYFAKNVRFHDLLRSRIYNDFKMALKDKKIGWKLEKRYEQYLRLNKLSYLSDRENELMDAQIDNDLNEVIKSLKKELQLDELIFVNLRFQWEKKSLIAFQTVLQSELQDVTSKAIRRLHSLNRLKPDFTEYVLNILYKEKLIPR